MQTRFELATPLASSCRCKLGKPAWSIQGCLPSLLKKRKVLPEFRSFCEELSSSLGSLLSCQTPTCAPFPWPTGSFSSEFWFDDMLPPLKSCPQRKGGTSPPCEVWLWEGIQRGASTKGEEQSIDPLSLSLSLSVYFLIFCFSFLVPLTGLEQLLIWNLFGSCSYWKLALTRSVPDGFAALAHRIHKLVILVWQRIWQQFDIFIHIHLYSSIFIFSLVGGKLVKTKLQSLCRIESKMLRSSPRRRYSLLWTSSSQVWLWDFWHFWHFWPLRLLMKRSTCLAPKDWFDSIPVIVSNLQSHSCRCSSQQTS